MSPRPGPRARRRKKTGKRRRRLRFSSIVSSVVPGSRTRRGWMRRFRRAPALMQLIVGLMLLCGLWFAANGIYQVVRKPSELFFPVSGAFHKTPAQTWRSYAPAFRKHSTTVIEPEFLAALAQVEGSGNPIARTYWRWRLRPAPFEVYRPASSAVGMYQITNGTFIEARRYCIHNNVVVEDGPWNDPRSCWFNWLYTRTIATHSIEMTSAYLDRRVARALARHRIGSTSLQQRQDLASIIHLCGAGAGERHVRRGLRLSAGQRCGDHDVARYLARVNSMKRVFKRLAAQD